MKGIDCKEIGNQFIVTLKRKRIVKVGEKEVDGWSEKWSKLNENQRKILLLIDENSTISRKEISEKLNINQSAIQKHMDVLKKRGFIKRVGPAKGGHWELIEK